MPKLSKKGVAFLLCTLVVAILAARGQAQAATPQPFTGQAAPLGAVSHSMAPAAATAQTSARLRQLAAPVALYPDALVAQILAAATYPDEVVQASLWVQENSALQGQELADAVASQAWDPSVMALTQFPSVLENMSTNLAWTSALGEAYLTNQGGVLGAVQVLRQRAQAAGKLQSTSEQTVTTDGSAIAIEPADPELVYVPAYDPWAVYGGPIAAYPGWVDVPGVFYPGADPDFAGALGIGLFAGFDWAWNDWGFDWHGGRMEYHHSAYLAHRGHLDDRHGFDGVHGAGAPAFHEHELRAGAGERLALGGEFHPGLGGEHGGAMHLGEFGGGIHAGGFHAGGGEGGFHGGGGHGGGGGGHR